MEQYKYGPLTWATIDDDSGNYYYPGTPPTGYDEQGIPIDEKNYLIVGSAAPNVMGDREHLLFTAMLVLP